MDAPRPPQLTDRTVLSPRRIFLVALAGVVGVEFVITLSLKALHVFPDYWEVLIDAALLAVLVTPLLYVLLYVPVRRAVEEIRAYTEELRYSEKKYSTVVNSSPAGIFILRDGAIVFGNVKLGQILDCQPEALLDQNLLSYIAEEDRPRLAPLVAEGEGDEPEREDVEVRVRTENGTARWVNIRTRPLYYKGEQSVLGMVQDVTERKNIEAELRALSARRLDIEEEERGRLARELHDGVGQSLSGIKFFIEHTLGQAEQSVERRAHLEQLQTLVPRIQDAIDEVRTMAMALRPSTLDDLGLTATLTWFLRELNQSCPHLAIEHRLEVADAEIPDRLGIVIYRTLQEATNNAAKHCGECTVRVTLQRDEEWLCLEVEDTGVGFDVQEVCRREVSRRGYGLGSMRERVELSGGLFSLEARLGEGTRVLAKWPV